MALLNTVTTITIGWVFDGEVKHLSSKINNLTQTLSWSITDILLIVYLSFTQKLVYFKKPWLTGFYSYFKLCGTIGSDLLRAKNLHFGAKLTGGQSPWWQGGWVPIQLLIDQNCD